MEDVLKVAAYICHRYTSERGRQIDEMKLHKLLYFAQRETIIQTGEPLFADRFEAWKYGPVMVSVRERFRIGCLGEELSDSAKEQYKTVFDTVFSLYAPKDSMSLSSITHGEYSWRKARQGVASDGKSSELISTEDIRKDAERVKIRRLLYEKVAPRLV